VGADRNIVFISYSHKDEKWLEALRPHLGSLAKDCGVEYWDDSRIQSGDKWRDEIEAALRSAKVAVLLVSANFLNSDFVRNEELPSLLGAAEADGTLILPILISHCRASKHPVLSTFQFVNPPSRPLAGMRGVSRDQLFVELTDRIEQVLGVAAPGGGQDPGSSASDAACLQSCADERKSLGVDSRPSDPPDVPLSGGQASVPDALFAVGTVEELVDAIGPNRILELKPGSYVLSEVSGRATEYVRWEEEHDGSAIVIHDVCGLTIRGLSQAKILTSPRYADVIAFENCLRVNLFGLAIGHAPRGYCTGGVLRVSGGAIFTIAACELFGCGTEGVSLQDVSEFTMQNSEIFDCTYGIASIVSAFRVSFRNCTFRNNGDIYGVVVWNSDYVDFYNCDINSNACDGPLFDVKSSFAVTINQGSIHANRCRGLGDGLLMKAVSVEGAECGSPALN
jgi:hypothetical protein